MKNKKDKGYKLQKLGTIKDAAPFALAIAMGADVNEKTGGTPIVESLLAKLLNCADITREANQITLKKTEMLIDAGADTSSIVYNYYDRIIYDVSKHLRLLVLLLKSGIARHEISSCGMWLNLLKGLQGNLADVAESIGGTGIVDGMEGIPDPITLRMLYHEQITRMLEESESGENNDEPNY